MPKVSFIGDLKSGDEVVDFFLVVAAQVRKTKKEKEYLSLKLADKTGEVDGKMWDPPAGFDLLSVRDRTFVKIRGTVSEYNDQLQLTVYQVREAEAVEIDQADFFRCSVCNPEVMFNELWMLLKDQLEPHWHAGFDCTNPTFKLLHLLLQENKEAFIKAPAAMSVHHCFLGGLLEHVLSMAKLSIPICEHYGLRKDLVLAACVLHDIGKIRELNYECGIGYSTEGTLIGHISIGMMLVSDACRRINIDQKLKIEILHMVASHHSSLSFGSPKVPMFKEAIAFSLIDMLDSKLEICKEAFRNNKAEGDFTAFSKYLEAFIYTGVDK